MSILEYASPFTITLSTGDSYNVPSLDHPNLAFVGFMSDDGTAITSISYHSTNGHGALDNFMYGQYGQANPEANPVPEPTTILLLGCGLLGLAGARRKIKS